MHISERLRERSQSLRRTFMERELIYRTFNFETLVGDICTPVLHPPNVLFSSFPLLLGPRSKTRSRSARNRTEVNVIAGEDEIVNYLDRDSPVTRSVDRSRWVVCRKIDSPLINRSSSLTWGNILLDTDFSI